MLTSTTKYIRKLADKTGKSYRELETMWRIAEATYRKLEMLDPARYTHLKDANAESEEIKNIFEKSILKLSEELSTEMAEPETTGLEEEEFAEDISEELPREEPEAFGEGDFMEDVPEDVPGDDVSEDSEDGGEFDIEEEETDQPEENADEKESNEESNEELKDDLFSKKGDVDRSPGKR